MIQLDYKSGEPIYDQIVNGIIKLKLLGALKKGDALPSVRSLALKLSVNPNTVQRAYQILEEKGITYSAKGKGSFIAEDHDTENAIRNMAKEEFIKAVQTAKQKGLTLNDLQAILKEEEK
ncbi:MAG: GntR family transcriptional regulator [Clostridiales bacterium]|nr:GntR family transcriptional regulator [Candidatus Equinaster intestinalis]